MSLPCLVLIFTLPLQKTPLAFWYVLEPGQTLGGNSHNTWVFPWVWVLLGFWTLRIVHNESIAILQLQFRFSFSDTGSHDKFLVNLCSGNLQFPMCVCLCPVLVGRVQFALCPLSLSKRSYWFFSLLSLVLVRNARMARLRFFTYKICNWQYSQYSLLGKHIWKEINCEGIKSCWQLRVYVSWYYKNTYIKILDL